jgi:hypothetical protein
MIKAIRKSIRYFPACLLFSFFTLINLYGFSQAVGDYRSQASGNWSTLATWQIWNGVAWLTPTGGQGYPGQNTATANVTIWNGNNVTENVNAANPIASLQMGSTIDASAGTLTFSANRTLTVTGAVTMGNAGTSSSGSINMVTGTLSVNSLAVSNATGSSFSPGTTAGTVRFNADNTIPSTVFTNFNCITFSGGTTTASAGLAINGNVTINAGASFDAGSFTHTVGGNWINNGGTFIASTSTIDFNNATVNQNIQGTGTSETFNNIIVDKTGFQLGEAGSIATLTVNGNVTVNNGTFRIIAAVALTVSGTTNISGTMLFSTSTFTNTFKGLITVSGTGTWTSGNVAFDIQGGITNSGTFTSGGGVYTFDTNNQDLNGTLSITNVTVNGVTLSNNNTFTVVTALTGTGTLTQVANATLNLRVAAASIATLLATASGNTVNYYGGAQTVIVGNYYNLILSTNGTKTMQTGTNLIAGDFTMSGTVRTTTADNLVIDGNLLVGDGTILTVGGFDFTVNGTTTIGAGISGRITISSATGTKTFVGLLTINAGGIWSNANAVSSDITMQNGITFNGATFTSGNGIYTFNTNDQQLNGTFTISNVFVTGVVVTNNNTLTVSASLTGPGTFAQAVNAVLNITGSSTITTLQATANGNTVNYNGGAQAVNSTNYYNLDFSNAGVKTLQAGTTLIGGDMILSGTARTTAVIGLTISGNLTIGAGTTFSAGAFTHSIGGNFTNDGTFNQNTSTMAFNGAALQTIGGASATTFRNLAINNSNGVTLDDGVNTTNKTVTTNLTLTNGYLTTTSTNLLILNSGATTTVANSLAGVPQHNSPYVNGPVRKIGNQAFVFPVGVLGTGCVPIGISAPGAATDAFDAQYIRSSASALGPITSPNLYSVSVCEYWTLNRTSGASTVDVAGYWNENSPCNGEAPGQYVTDLTTISLAHFNGASWDNNSTSVNSFTTGGTISGGITWSGVSTFSPFALGNNTAAKVNPLPILLDYFTAVKSNGYNQLSWKAECSESSNTFEAQRSYDGTVFISLDTIHVSLPSDCSQPFIYNDYDASGKNAIYYRIKMTDVNGIIKYSDTKLITNDAAVIDFINVAPNPVKNDATIKISASHNEKVELVIAGLDGKELLHSTVQTRIGTNIFSLQTSQLAKGMYIIKGVFANGEIQTLKFIKE